MNQDVTITTTEEIHNAFAFLILITVSAQFKICRQNKDFSSQENSCAAAILGMTTSKRFFKHKTSTTKPSHPKHMSEVVSVDVFHAALGLVVRQEVGDAGADGSPGDRLFHLVDRR